MIFDDLNFAARPYDPWLAYGQSKTANVLFAVEATKRWASEGITANAVHPGGISATNLSRHMDPEALAGVLASGTFTDKTVEQGAATSVLVATSPLLDGIGGRYFEDCHEAPVLDPGARKPAIPVSRPTPSTPTPPPACGSSRPPPWPATPRPASRSRAGACRWSGIRGAQAPRPADQSDSDGRSTVYESPFRRPRSHDARDGSMPDTDPMRITVLVNGRPEEVRTEQDTALLYVLRNHLGLKGTRFGCGLGLCGTCLVLVDGQPAYSCDTPMWAVEGRNVTTVEGLGTPERPHPVARAIIDGQAAQCGYCISGVVISAAALLAANDDPGEDEVRAALDGNLCRCGAHNRIVRAVLAAAASLRASQDRRQPGW